MTKELTIEKAIELIRVGFEGNIMPDFKVQHCLSVADTASRIAGKCNLDAQMAFVLGLIHDIGCHFGSNQHPFNGYRFLKSLGYGNEYANVCLTHSFLNGDPNCSADGLLVEDGKVHKNKIIPWENQLDSDFVLNFLVDHKYTELEEIINYCDLVCTGEVVGLDERLKSLITRKGVHVTTPYHIKAAKALEKRLEQKMGCSMLDLFPETLSGQGADYTYTAFKL